MLRRKSDVFLWLVAIQICVLVILMFHALLLQERAVPRLHETVKIVQYYGITDLSLFTEARYTRHASMADMNTAFQDHPFAFEHFPSGSLVVPPRHLRNHDLD